MTTMGKFRHLSRCSTVDGHFVILAIDHRTNLLKSLNRYAPYNDEQFTDFKQQIIVKLLPESSAVLADPAYGLGVGITEYVIGSQYGVLSPIEVTDYELHPSKRPIEFIPNWSVEKIKLMGGDGVKLLLPYHPDDDAAAKHAVVDQIVEQCARFDIPFFLEPIAYSPDPTQSLTDDELLQLSVQMAQTFSAAGADVLKMQFPLTPTSDEARWAAACEALDAACDVPWALLSAGVDFETFARQAKAACDAGASGVIVGRAVWAEAVELQGEDREQFISDIARERMAQLAALCKNHAVPWYERVTTPDSSTTWYEGYGG